MSEKMNNLIQFPKSKPEETEQNQSEKENINPTINWENISGQGPWYERIVIRSQEILEEDGYSEEQIQGEEMRRIIENRFYKDDQGYEKWKEGLQQKGIYREKFKGLGAEEIEEYFAGTFAEGVKKDFKDKMDSRAA